MEFEKKLTKICVVYWLWWNLFHVDEMKLNGEGFIKIIKKIRRKLTGAEAITDVSKQD